VKCDGCGSGLRGHYLQITFHNHVAGDGPGSDVRELARVCSARCLITWGYGYGAARVAQALQLVRSARITATTVVQGVLDVLRGPRGGAS
jgi:hypothetical protein